MPTADLILGGGGVFAPDHVGPPPTRVAVARGRIVAVGGAEVDELAGPGTDRVDLGGGLLVPGFQDAHAHPVQAGNERLNCDLSALAGLEGYRAAVAARARRQDADGPDGWVRGGGWMLAAFPGGLPRREQLDDVAGGHPVLLINRDHHGAWVNSTALRIAGVDASTPDPAGGRIERDPDGTPTGMLHEAAVDLVAAWMPAPTSDELVDALLEAQRCLQARGVTAWQDAILGAYGSHPDPSTAYATCAADGRLTARVVGALWWDRERGLEQIPKLVERRARLTGGRFRATSVKIMQDGIVENGTAAVLDPYLGADGRPTENHGHSFVDPDLLAEAVTRLDLEGFQVHVHAIGDRAVMEALDAFEAAVAANGRNDNRHHIAHLQLVRSADVPRFAELGVTANLQAYWACHEEQMDTLTLPFLTERVADRQYPFGELHRSGARLAMGSDWPVTTADPLAIMHVAVNRSLPDAEGDQAEAFLPGQALTIETALRASTSGSAFVNHLDDTGTIRVGALADLAVLDRDVRTVSLDEIADVRVRSTYVEGERVF